jgi:hypothetical protein
MRKKNWSRVPDWRLTPRQTSRLSVGRKLTSTEFQPLRGSVCFANRILG